jgi:hypothetical protein
MADFTIVFKAMEVVSQKYKDGWTDRWMDGQMDGWID